MLNVFGTISNSDSQLLRDGRRFLFGFYFCSNDGDIWLQEFGAVLLTKDPNHYHSIKKKTWHEMMESHNNPNNEIAINRNNFRNPYSTKKHLREEK